MPLVLLRQRQVLRMFLRLGRQQEVGEVAMLNREATWQEYRRSGQRLCRLQAGAVHRGKVALRQCVPALLCLR